MILTSTITQGIKISAITQFHPEHSQGQNNSFAFSYKIRIENNGNCTVQLKSRCWIVFNGNGRVDEVQGDGVVGFQPILEPGQHFEYVSGCCLQTEMGKMVGNYMMERVRDGKFFVVDIPELHLMAPYLLN